MKYRNTYQKKCPICGKLFECSNSKTICCGPECRCEREKQKRREYSSLSAARKRLQNEKMQRANGEESLAEVNAKARAAGMSYGQYMLARRVANG